MIKYLTDKGGIAQIIFHREDAPVNSVNGEFAQLLEETVDRALEDSNVIGIILRSTKKDFMVGADIKAVSKDGPEYFLKNARQFRATLRKLETNSKPVVAVINGTALGGGYELAMAAHYRIALDSPDLLVGLPEVLLGFMPGGGGTMRLPRMVGAETGLRLILEGKKVPVREALKLKMVDKITDSPVEMLIKAREYIMNTPVARQPWDRQDFKFPGGDPQTSRNLNLFSATAGILRKKTRGLYPAPFAILNAIYENCQLPFDRADEVEDRYFEQCIRSDVSRNMMRTLFVKRKEADKGIARPVDVPENKFSKIGIVGAGMMGAGIAYVAAQAGIEVILKDLSLELAEKGKDYSRKLLQAQVEKKKLTQKKADKILERIHTSERTEEVSACELVIEAVFEDRKLKAKVSREAESVISEQAVMASNTSTLPISGLAKASQRPENFIGLHFFSPVDKMPLIEIIKGAETSAFALAKAMDFVKLLRKTPVVVNDSRGFFTSRVFETYLFEGFECLKEGVAPALLENAGKASGMPVGPLALADEISLELMYKISKQTEKDLGIMGEAVVNEVAGLMLNKLKRPGKKAQKGFYEYPKEESKFLWPDLTQYFKPSADQPEVEMISDRLLIRQSLEAVKCLEEGVVENPGDADLASVLGWGFPVCYGGVLSYIDTIGVRIFIEKCEQLTQLYGERFKPSPKLYEMAEKNEKFHPQPDSQQIANS